MLQSSTLAITPRGLPPLEIDMTEWRIYDVIYKEVSSLSHLQEVDRI